MKEGRGWFDGEGEGLFDDGRGNCDGVCLGVELFDEGSEESGELVSMCSNERSEIGESRSAMILAFATVRRNGRTCRWSLSCSTRMS